MALEDDITVEVEGIFGGRWTERAGTVVPAATDINLGTNDAVTFDAATVLYADLSGSTQMVDTKKPRFAAEVYKAYLASAARVIRSEGGVITAYDGDRVMAVFIGDRKNSRAASCALKINYAVQYILMPSLRRHWTAADFVVKQVVGIDTSPMLVARTGIRGGNDLVWVGRAANWAAKLSSIDEPGYRTYITAAVFKAMADDAKYGGNPRQLMWEPREWKGKSIYRSSWWRRA